MRLVARWGCFGQDRTSAIGKNLRDLVRCESVLPGEDTTETAESAAYFLSSEAKCDEQIILTRNEEHR